MEAHVLRGFHRIDRCARLLRIQFLALARLGFYRFSAYREGMSPAEIGRAPTISAHRGDTGLELQSAVRLERLPELRDAHHLRIALAAVIEDEKEGFSYWGLRHAPGKADFHHPDGFALEVTRA
jgi:hypothetical protein